MRIRKTEINSVRSNLDRSRLTGMELKTQMKSDFDEMTTSPRPSRRDMTVSL